MAENSKALRVLFFGDSICVGQGVSIHKGWVTRTSQRLAKLAERYRKEILVINSSVNGCTTRQALERMPYHIQSKRPHIMIVQFGINDCNYWKTDKGVPRVSPKAFESNLEEIIARAFNFGTKRILLNTNHPIGKKLPFPHLSYYRSNKQYNSIIRQVAISQGNKVVLTDIEKIFERHLKKKNIKLSDLLFDLMHLNEEGHKLYFKNIYPIIEKTVLELIDAKSYL